MFMVTKAEKIDLTAFARRLDHARIAAGFRTQKEFADAIGSYLPTVNKWLNGHSLPETETLGVISQAVGETIEELLYGTRIVPPKQGGGPVQSEALQRVFASDAGERLTTRQKYALAEFLDGVEADEWRVRAVVELVSEMKKRPEGST